jgi:hypothetical protein
MTLGNDGNRRSDGLPVGWQAVGLVQPSTPITEIA